MAAGKQGSKNLYELRKIEDFKKGDIIQIDGIDCVVHKVWESHGMHFLRYSYGDMIKSGTQMYADAGALYTARKRGV